MDKLDTIFKMQKELNDYIIEKRSLNFTKEEWIQKRSLALIDEVAELLNEINYKWWKNPKPVDEKAVKEELVDILHFYIGMCIDGGLSADELFQIYLDKNKENYDRQRGLSQKKGYE
ncbi:MAG: dUTPase [Firmicutes bacterium]|nr:dUTPase [Bacillota bacterium]